MDWFMEKYYGWIHCFLYNPIFGGLNRQTLQKGPSNSEKISTLW